ncbi:Calcium-dependent secretion activator [Portunus trituberculatus]|uniref:Calcium-dependent secretion activator n=1 Tax=Portunus trituberculatus TaxID=210409 RepID=A0A5B7FKV8_PORTR|nr:Calcium-dependent secretion activator [Portunus trituberculatus]
MQQPLNSELIMPKEQLFDMFQQILGIKKFEHQLLFNALQLDSQDEQAAAIRRELDGRMQKVAELERVSLYPPPIWIWQQKPFSVAHSEEF